MNAAMRALRYVGRKPGKAAVLTSVMFIACCMALLSLSVLDATQSLSKALKQESSPEIAVYRESDDSFVAEDLSRQLVDLPSVANANRIRTLTAFPVGFKNIEGGAPDPGYEQALRLNAYDDLRRNSPFADQLQRLVQGRLLEATDSHAAVIHVDLAQANNLALGDNLTLRGESGQETTVEIVGLFAAAGGNEGEQAASTARNQTFNQVFSDNATAAALGAEGFREIRLTPTNPDQLAALRAEVAALCGAGYGTELYDASLAKISLSLDQASGAAKATLALAGATALAATSLLLAMWGRTRVHERAILLAMGYRKTSVTLQALTETALLFLAAILAAAAVSFAAAPPLVQAITGNAGGLSAATGAPLEASTLFNEAALVGIIGLLAAVILSVVVCLATLKRNPRDLLTSKN